MQKGIANYDMVKGTRVDKRIWCFIIILELFIWAGILLFLSTRPSVELNYSQDDLVYDSGEAGFYLDKAYAKRYVSTPDFILPKGFYTLEAEYEYNGSVRIEVVHSDGLVNANISESLTPTNPLETVSNYDFRVRYSGRMVRVQGRLSGEAADGDYILLRNIRIVSSPLTVLYIMFLWSVIFLLADISFYLICHKDRITISEEAKEHIKILILLTIVISIPLMTNYLFNEAHDLRFHLSRIEGIKNELLNGHFPVKMQSYWLHGHGYPVSVFYGDLLLYIPAVLRIFGVSAQAAYNFYVLLINTGTVFISYFCFSKMSNAKAGLICTIVFSLNIFRLHDVYIRAAVGEYTAMMFMPLVLYGMWCIYVLPEESERQEKDGEGWIPLTVGCVGIFLAHMLSTEMAAFFMILAAIILWKKTFSKKRFFVLMKAAVLTLLLCLWFLIPFLDYMISDTYVVNDPTRYVPYKLEAKSTFVARLFMNRYSFFDGSSGASSGVANGMASTVGLASMFVLAGWFVFCFGKKRDTAEKKEEYLAVFMSVLCLGMTLYFFPYTWIVDKLPFMLMIVKSIQYSWRFYVVAGVLLSWLLCIVLRKDWITQKKKQIFAGAIVFIAFWQGISFMSGVLNEANVFRVFQNGGLSSMDIVFAEYIPVELGEKYTLENYIDRLSYAEDTISVSDWYRDKGAIAVSLTNGGSETAQIEVPLILYKGYHAVTDSGAELPITPGVSHRISVSVPAGYSGTIRIEFREPWYWRVCELISLITLISLILCPYIKGYIKKRHNNAPVDNLVVDS